MRINEIAESSSEDRFKKYIRPVVKTTPKIEKTTNPSGRTTDHIEWKVTTPTGEIHRYKSKKQAQEHYDSFGQQGVAEYGPAATAALQQGQHPIQVAAADRKDQENTLNINRSAMKAQQDVANGLDPTQTAAGNGVAEAAAPVTHRIGLTVTDPNHPMVSKRGETYQKSVRVTGPDREAAINQAIAHHRRKGYKVHDHHYLGTVDQGVAEGSLNELSSDLLKRSAQVATDKRNQAMDPELHNALGGGYMNPLATHYDNVSQKMDNRAAQVRKKETIQKIASKIASPAVMRKMGMSDMEEGVAEGFNGEYDDEAGMADNNLETLRRAVDGIDNVINTGDNLPEWCQEKIAVAKSMLVTVWDYMRSEEQIEDPEIAEMYEAMQLMAESMAHKHRVSVDLVWESFEALDDHMLYETAAWRRKEGKSAKGGLNAKGVASYRRENPGSKLQTAVTTKPSKLKPGSKAAKRRKSFCARMSGVKGPAKKPNGKPTRKTLALRKWNC